MMYKNNWIKSLCAVVMLSGCGGESTEENTSRVASEQVNISSSASEGGTISPSVQSVSINNQAVFTIVAKDGYELESIEGCEGSLDGNKFTTSATASDCSLTATFIEIDNGFIVTVASNTGGGLFPSSQVLKKGDSATFEINIEDGYQIDVIEGCNGILEGDLYVVEEATDDCQITANFSPSIYTITASSVGSGVITPAVQEIETGKAATFNVNADVGFHISSVSGCNGTLNGDKYITEVASGNCAIQAVFAQNSNDSVVISTNISGGGSISPNTQTLTKGSVASFELIAQTGYQLSSVSGCQGGLQGNSYQTGAVISDCTIEASFIPVITTPTFSVKVNSNAGGFVVPSFANVESGTTQTFTLFLRDGYLVDSVKGCNGVLSGNKYTTAVITSDCDITVNFVEDVYTVSTSASGGGSLSPGTQVITSGESAIVSVTADSGYKLDTISGCAGTLSNNIYTITEVTENCSVSATFVEDVYTVSTSASEGGSLSPETQSITNGEVASVNVSIDPGYIIASIDGCSGSLVGDVYITEEITEDCVITAVFSDELYTVSSTVNAGGSISPTIREVASGGTGAFTVSADSGFKVDTIVGCGGTFANGTYTTGVISADCNIDVSFVAVGDANSNFSYSVDSGEIPLTVQFTCLDTEASAWQWDFDNDGIVDSTDENPTYIYRDHGLFSVSLNTSNNQSSDSKLVVNAIAALTPGTRLFDIGEGKTYSSTHEVELHRLQAGDIVRLFAKSSGEGYHEQLFIKGVGTAQLPIIVGGVANAQGDLPLIDGDGALSTPNFGDIYWNEDRQVVLVGQYGQAKSDYIQLSNIRIQNAVRGGRFVDERNRSGSYAANVAGIRFANIGHAELKYMDITGNENGIFSSTTDELYIHHSSVYENGVTTTTDQEHNFYLGGGAGSKVIIEANFIGDLLNDGQQFKSRAETTIFKYNWLEGGKNSLLDFVEDANNGKSDAYVYGNVLIKQDPTNNTRVFHFGGDNGSIDRSGDLYFYNNTVIVYAQRAYLFQLNEDNVHAHVDNNIFYYHSTSGRTVNMTCHNVLDAGKLSGANNAFSSDFVIGGLLSSSLSVSSGDFVDFNNQDFRLISSSGLLSSPNNLPNHALPVTLQYQKHKKVVVRNDSGTIVGAFR